MSLKVGATCETKVQFRKANGSPVAPPTGAVVTFTSSAAAEATVATVRHTGGTPSILFATVKGVAPGTPEISAALTASTGGPLKNKAGATIPNPAPVTVNVVATTATTPVEVTLTVTTA